ncbi:MAG: hypothetical protein O3C63_05775 [Cyanobacteria bacterium]|nr:hypothetical protein [Cyanobacteriota bacterium]MDA1021557.1 hypothetical protein [Cyanobacteriota bacterium]
MIRKIQTVSFVFLVAMLFQWNLAVVAKVAVTTEQVVLKGYLKKEYKAQSFNLNNELGQDLEIFDVHFTGDRPSESATNEALDGSGNEIAILWAFGLSLFWLFLIPLAIALVATPFMLIGKGSKKKKTRLESYMLGEKGPRELTIKSGEQEEIVALFPKELTQTRLSFKYKNLETNEVSSHEYKFVF